MGEMYDVRPYDLYVGPMTSVSVGSNEIFVFDEPLSDESLLKLADMGLTFK